VTHLANGWHEYAEVLTQRHSQSTDGVQRIFTQIFIGPIKHLQQQRQWQTICKTNAQHRALQEQANHNARCCWAFQHLRQPQQ
jgi:hypothetical protein